MRHAVRAIFVVLCLAYTCHAFELNLGKRLHHKRARTGPTEDAQMCKTMLKAFYTAGDVGQNLNTLTNDQALGCWCLWSKVQLASQLTSAAFRLYNPNPSQTVAAVAKGLLKNAWKSYRQSLEGGTNLIGRVVVSGVLKSVVYDCMDLSGDCSALTNNCKLWRCLKAPDQSYWFTDARGQCERTNAVMPCGGDTNCRPKAPSRCPVGDNTKCRCAKGLPNSCACVSKLPAGADQYCTGTGDLA